MTTRRDFLKTGAGAVACSALLRAKPASGAREYHVAPDGNDHHEGTLSRPLKSISAASAVAMPGDVICVHTGIYRERVTPPRGGASDANRIVYQAASGERVEISGAEVIKGWTPIQGDIWTVTVPNSFFGSFNPYSDVIHGDWFNPKGRVHHTGAVYLDGEWLAEAATHDEVLQDSATAALWFAQVDADTTTIWAQFKGADPNKRLVEINVRQTVFYPEKTGIDFITVRGFVLCKAATPWAPPTAEQIGLIGTHWSKGWIIEKNVIRHSICSGVALGKYGDQWDNTSANSAEGYVKTIQRALANGWSRENVGHHIVHNNTIYNCGQAGIVGSLGAAFSTVTGNTIYAIHVRRSFTGAEMAGIKFHGAIDIQITGNHIYQTCLGLWLDWLAQGSRISGNLFHDNDEDVFVEVDHGPFIFDNNIFLSSLSLRDRSQGGAYVHNLFGGALALLPYDSRLTPFLKAHSAAIAGFHDNPPGDSRFYNNVFVRRADLSVYDKVPLPMMMEGNVFLDGAKPSRFEQHPVVKTDIDPGLRLIPKKDGLYLAIKLKKAWIDAEPRRLVTSALLGRASIPDLPYEEADGSSVSVDLDYFGKARNKSNPAPGPFEYPSRGDLMLKVAQN
jgi:alpha-N-arabinofuranosidase